jgi:FKBP-type peptidyl-prolyl cis-trans isomerase
MVSALCRTSLLLLVLLAAPALRAQREKLPSDDLEIVEKTWPNAKKTNTGIRYIVEREGQGDVAQPGDMVSVVYVGTLLDGRIFDKISNPSRPFTFRLGRDVVIQAWDDILERMKKGERRLVIVPPEMGYGTRGMPPRIPRDATLVFEMELVEIKRE